MSTPSLAWLARVGRHVVDERGAPVFLRGVGLGNWLLPEGYMWLFGDECASPRQIEGLVARLIGDEAAAAFWRRFRDTYVTEEDIAAIAACGYNSVRIPINSRVVLDEDGGFREDGFALIERCVQWCREHGLYVVLDLHGAPGGQTGANIDDSLGWPDLFTDRRNEELTIALWVELARRYRDDPTIALYDLLNEPVPGDHRAQYTEPLVRLYKELIAAIREVDTRHLITLEGTNWSNDWSMFDGLWDDQLVLQFHKYWNPPDVASIQHYLDERERLDVPIWLGESGENGLGWFEATFGMCDELGIGWNFWQWKKLGTEISPVSIRVPRDWERIRAAARGEEDVPREDATRIFEEYLVSIPLAACERLPRVANAMLRRVPVLLHAEHFGHRGEGVSWHGAKRDTGLVGFREDDGITIGFVDPARTGEIDFRDLRRAERETEKLEARLVAGEWAAYEVELAAPGRIAVAVEGVADADGVVELSIGGAAAEPVEAGESLLSVRSAELPAGRHELRVAVSSGSAAIRTLDVRLA